MKLTVSEKDKKTLMILLVALIVFCSWYFGYRNINNMTVAMKEERNELTKKYDSLYPLFPYNIYNTYTSNHLNNHIQNQ